jgi:hypothetical protein
MKIKDYYILSPPISLLIAVADSVARVIVLWVIGYYFTVREKYVVENFKTNFNGSPKYNNSKVWSYLYHINIIIAWLDPLWIIINDSLTIGPVDNTRSTFF